MADPPPQDVISVHVKTELQYDTDAQQSPFPSGSISALAVTASSQGDGLLNAYYINNGKVYNAYQDTKLATTGSPRWSVEDMRFPSKDPNVLRAFSIPNSPCDIVVAITLDGSSASTIVVGKRYPQWSALPLPVSNAKIRDCRFFTTATSVLQIALLTHEGRLYIGDPTTIETDGWVEDASIWSMFSNTVTDFSPDPSLGSSINRSVFGYTIASPTGICYLTGGGSSLSNPAEMINIDKGNYTSVCTAPLPGPASSSPPMAFAVDQFLNAFYFQPQDDGTFVKVPIFAGIKVQQMEAIVRSQPSDTEGMKLWAEVFAMDPSGAIYHLESAYDSATETNQFVLLGTGSYSVLGWRANAARVFSGVVSIATAPSPDGTAYILTYSQSSAVPNALTFLTQDPETTDWNPEPVMLPALSTTTPSIKKSRVYYVEATILDGNNVPMPGRAAAISSVQYATININGRLITLDRNRGTTAVSNASGRICFTLDASDGLGVPTFTFWAEGMDVDSRIDVNANGDIQSLFAGLDIDKLRAAEDQEDPTHPKLFPEGSVSKDQLQKAADSVKKVIEVIDPAFKELNVPLSEVDHSNPSRLHLYHRTRPSVARTRKRGTRTLGHIRGKANHGVHIILRPTLEVRTISSSEAANLRARSGGFLGMDINWGDLWQGIRDGFYIVKDYFLDPILDGINATINFLKEGVEYAWNGIVNFVKTAFDFVGSIFEAIGAAFEKLFSWLAFILNWDDIKRSADEFAKTVNGFEAWGEALLTETIPNITKDAFANAKTWLNDNFATVEQALAGYKVGTYDTDKLPSVAGGVLGTSQGLLDDLPSTATWLMNKVFNASGGDAGSTVFSSATTVFDNLFATFYKNAQDVGLSSDLEAAYKALGDVFLTFKDRGLFDASSWVSLIELAKAFIFVVLDIAELAALTFVSVAAEALKFITNIINAPLDIPVVSWVFKEVTGVELTVLTGATYIIAIPFTIVYKIIVGEAPFTTQPPTDERLGMSDSDKVTIARGCVFILGGLWTGVQDFTAGLKIIDAELEGVVQPLINDEVPRVTCFQKFATGMNITISCIFCGLGGYPSVPGETGAVLAGWCFSAGPAILNICWAVGTRGARGPPADISGQVLLTLIGVGQFICAAVETAQTDKWTPKKIVAVTSMWFLPWINLSRWLNTVIKRVDPVDRAFVIAAEIVIDLVCGLGCGTAMIASGVIQDKKDSSIEDSREVKKIEAAADDKELDDETALDGDS